MKTPVALENDKLNLTYNELVLLGMRRVLELISRQKVNPTFVLLCFTLLFFNILKFQESVVVKITSIRIQMF